MYRASQISLYKLQLHMIKIKDIIFTKIVTEFFDKYLSKLFLILLTFNNKNNLQGRFFKTTST